MAMLFSSSHVSRNLIFPLPYLSNLKNDGSISQIHLELAPYHYVSPMISLLIHFYPRFSSQSHAAHLCLIFIKPKSNLWLTGGNHLIASQCTQVKSKKLWLGPNTLLGGHCLFPQNTKQALFTYLNHTSLLEASRFWRHGRLFFSLLLNSQFPILQVLAEKPSLVTQLFYLCLKSFLSTITQYRSHSLLSWNFIYISHSEIHV